MSSQDLNTEDCLQDQRRDFIVIAREDIPPDERSALLSKGYCLTVRDDLLTRLLQLEEENRQLKSLSITDELTGLYNKRFFNHQLNIEMARTRRNGEPFCLVLIDLDNFKTLNDTRGHIQGDGFLVAIGRRLKANIRPMDFGCRFGGDEFAVILPATTLRDGVAIAERCHKLIAAAGAEIGLPVSSSIGIDQLDASSALTADAFVQQVDQWLYQAKNEGKGKVAHPPVQKPEAHAVSRTEKEFLCQIFQSHTPDPPLPSKDRRKKWNRNPQP